MSDGFESCDGRVLIVGGSGGIGAALARLLVADGVPVTIAAREQGRLSRVADEVGAETLRFDARDEGETSAALRECGPIFGVVNCAGSILLKPAHLTKSDEFIETFRTNALTAFNVVRSAAPVLRRSGGSIVLLSSCAARAGLANHEAVAAAKAAVEGLTRSAAATYAPWGVRVNAVAPGLVRTPLTERITSNDAALAASTALHPIGRIGEPGDVARCIRFLLDPANDWITGEIVAVDGGLGSLRGRAGNA